MDVRHNIFLTALFLVVFVFFFVVLFGNRGLVHMIRMGKERDRIVEQNERIREENAELFRTIRRLRHDPMYVESVARDELGLVGEDEVIFHFDDGGAGEASPSEP